MKGTKPGMTSNSAKIGRLLTIESIVSHNLAAVTFRYVFGFNMVIKMNLFAHYCFWIDTDRHNC